MLALALIVGNRVPRAAVAENDACVTCAIA
jgi:hypothetical protein